MVMARVITDGFEAITSYEMHQLRLEGNTELYGVAFPVDQCVAHKRLPARLGP